MGTSEIIWLCQITHEMGTDFPYALFLFSTKIQLTADSIKKGEKIVTEVRIRGINASALARIDQLAKKKHLSRNEYLKRYIESLSVLDDLKAQEERYASLVDSLTDVLAINNNIISDIKQYLESR